MHEKLKILYVITKGNWGGAQKYVYEIATGLPKDSFEAVVAHGAGDILPAKLQESSIRTINLPGLGRDVNFLKDFRVFFDLISLFRKEKPDVVHLNSSKIGALGALAARCAGIKKTVFTVHGFAFNEDRPWIQKKIIAFVSWLTIALCTDVIFISKIELERSQKSPLTSGKLHLVYNGMAVPDYFQKEEAKQKLAEITRQSPAVFENNIIIVSIGELTKNKGYEYALDALRNSPNFTYTIMGTGDMEKELREKILSFGLEKKVFLAGFVRDASRFLKAGDIFLLPSIKEGVPYVILEAGLAELPVVSTHVGGIPEIIQDMRNGILVEPKNPSALTAAIDKLIYDVKMRNSLGESLKSSVMEKFSMDSMLAGTIAIYF